MLQRALVGLLHQVPERQGGELQVDRAGLSRPIVASRARPTGIGRGGKTRRRQQTLGEVRILVVAQLLGADGRQPGDEHDRLVLRQLHHLAGGEQRPGRLLPAHHHMAKPGREAMAGIVALGSQLGRGSERVRNALGGALVIGRKGDAHMAIVENGVVLAIGLGDLVERLGDQIDPHAIAGHEGERALEEVEPTERRKLVEHHQKLALLRAAFDSAERFGEAAADLVENKPDQRLGAADVGGRHDQIERDRLLGRDQVGDAPVAGLGVPRNGRIAIEVEEAHRGREHAGAFVLGLVEQLARGRGDHGVNLRPLVRAEMVGRHHDAQRLLKRLRRIGEQLGHPRERLPLLGIEDMQDDARRAARGSSSPNDCAAPALLPGRPGCRRCSARRGLRTVLCALRAAGCSGRCSDWSDRTGGNGRTATAIPPSAASSRP